MILAIALALAAQGDAARWVQLDQDGERTNYIDSLNIRVAGDRRMIWQRVDYATARPDGATTVLYEVEIVCSARTMALLSVARRDRNGGLLGTHAYSGGPQEPILPDTVGELYLDAACARQGSI